MDRPVQIGIPPVNVILRRSARARRFSLRVSRVDGRVTLSLPDWAAEAEAMRFARSQEEWIRAALAARPAAQSVRIGGPVAFEGQTLILQPGAVRSVQAAAGVLMVPQGAGRTGARVRAFLRNAARVRLHEACTRHARTLGRPFRSLTLRDTRSRWGSCSADGRLMFSWRLVMAPPAVLDYVAAHEVAHLAQMNHSPAFWAEVARLMPGYRVHRYWLRDHGQALHAWSFED